MSLFDQVNTIADIQRLVDDGVRESETLEYKSADAVLRDENRAETAKDVSAFANSAGGVLLYGVATKRDKDRTVPITLKPIDPTNIDRILRVISGDIRHPIPGVRWKGIPEGSPSVFVVDVLASALAPHQSVLDKRYYRRHLDESVPMSHELVELYFGRRLGPFLVPELRSVISMGSTEPGFRGLHFHLLFRNEGAGSAREISLVTRQPATAKARLSSTIYGEGYPNYGTDEFRELRAEPVGLVIHPGDAKPVHPGLVIYYPTSKGEGIDSFTFRIFANSMRPPEYEIIVRWTGGEKPAHLYIKDAPKP
jgi:hypothetical protein